MLTPASMLGSTVHMLQREIYYSSQELQGLALLPHVFEHQSCSEPLYFWRSFEFCFKHCIEFFISLHSEVSVLAWYRILTSCIYNPCLVKQWHKSRRQEFLRGAADCPCDSNEVSLPLAVHNTRRNQTTWTSKAAKVVWMV